MTVRAFRSPYWPAMEYQFDNIPSYDLDRGPLVWMDARTTNEQFDAFAPVIASLNEQYQAEIARWQKAPADIRPAMEQWRRELD